MVEYSENIARLIESLGHPDKRIIRQSVDALVELGSRTPEIRGAVAAAMSLAPADKRWPMAYVLAQIAPLDDTCFAALEDGLGGTDPDIRWAVVVLLVRLAKQRGGNIVERLIALTKSGTAMQRRMAVYTLRDIGAEDAASQQALRDALRDADPLVRVAALTSLKIFPETARSAVEEVLRMLAGDPDARVRATAPMALAQSSVESEAIRQALEQAARGGDANVAKAARAALDILQKNL
jgi:HEAT repeat protein